jgi:hypothetical protein
MKTLMRMALIALVLLPAVASAQPNGYFFPPHWMYDPTLGALVAPNRILLPDGTMAAPALAFSGDSSIGLYRSGTSIATWRNSNANGGVPISLKPADLTLGSAYALGWSNSTASTSATDLFLTRGAANTLYQKNGANPQAFWLANTDDGAGNYERAEFRWNTNILEMGSTAGGTGAVRPVRLMGQYMSFAGNALPSVGDTRQLGDSSNTWTSAYLSRSIQGSRSKTLTDAAAAASFVRIAVPTNGFAGGEVIYTATSTDGSAILATTSSCVFSATDIGGTVIAGAPNCRTPSTSYTRANTLVCTISGAVSTTNYDLQASCTDDKAAAQTVTLYYRLDMPQPNTVTPQ